MYLVLFIYYVNFDRIKTLHPLPNLINSSLIPYNASSDQQQNLVEKWVVGSFDFVLTVFI